MSDFKEKLKKTARLAALKITPDEEELYVREIESILNLMEEFQDLNTDGVEPLRSISDHSLTMREDIAEDPRSEDKVLKSTNHVKYGYFVTPKFVD